MKLLSSRKNSFNPVGSIDVVFVVVVGLWLVEAEEELLLELVELEGLELLELDEKLLEEELLELEELELPDELVEVEPPEELEGLELGVEELELLDEVVEEVASELVVLSLLSVLLIIEQPGITSETNSNGKSINFFFMLTSIILVY